jgi:hypothetical protein
MRNKLSLGQDIFETVFESEYDISFLNTVKHLLQTNFLMV